jgi:hypothetical protein
MRIMLQDEVQPQRRARRVAMTDSERDEFLAGQRTCRVGSLNPDGGPHVTPLWFVWDGDALWLFSTTRSQRWANLMRDARISVVVDAGDEYSELRGIEFLGEVEQVGDVPRSGLVPDPALALPERLFAEKYLGGAWVDLPQPHAWLRLQPRKQVSWDFRKLPQPA